VAGGTGLGLLPCPGSRPQGGSSEASGFSWVRSVGLQPPVPKGKAGREETRVKVNVSPGNACGLPTLWFLKFIFKNK
jgi:hypothetical protein